MMSRVGHAFIKQQMREADAVFAGELSGHYYFKANSTEESSSMATFALANIVTVILNFFFYDRLVFDPTEK